MSSSPHVLIIVQNLSVPLDRRVWLECQALTEAGYRVSVICPRGPGEAASEVLDGVRIHRYSPPPEAVGAAGYAREFGYCWLATARLALRIWRTDRFDVIQACNPPDTYWALARLFRPFGVKFVFDHHDLNPELFRSRFGEPRGPLARAQLRALTWLERRTFQSADHVISTNTSYAGIAVERGGRSPAEVTVVRSGPDTSRMRPLDLSAADHASPSASAPAIAGTSRLAPATPQVASVQLPADRYLLAYLGIMGPQDGIDVLVRSLHALIDGMGRRDVHAVLMGFGDSLTPMRRLAEDLGIGGAVTFTGRVEARTIAEVLSVAHIGLGPDPSSPLNDVSTMNKTMEYMAYALPVVTFDLPETRKSAGDAAVYVPPGDEKGFAQAINDLLDDPAARVRLGLAARTRAVADLDWQSQKRAYVRVYADLTGHRPPPELTQVIGERRRAERPPRDPWDRPQVDLRGGERLAEAIRARALV